MRVLNDTLITWGQHANGVPTTRFVRHGAAVSIVPGSALYGAYGGPSNLAALPRTGDDGGADHSELGD